MLRNWRIRPESSRRCWAISGKRCSSSARRSGRVAGPHSTEESPLVKRRKAVGISTLIFMSAPSDRRRRKRYAEVFFKCQEARLDGRLHGKLSGKGVRGFKSVAGDAKHGGFVGMDASLGN